MAPSKRPVRRIPRDEDEDQEVEAPRSRRPAARDDDDDDADDEEEATPAAKKPKGAAANPSDMIRGGWTEGQKQMDSTSSFAQTLKLEEKAVVIKFLGDTPYANFRRHWIERTTKDQGKQLRAWTCLQTIGKDCPLCEVGDRAQAVAAFNVALIGDDGQVLLKSWDVGPRLFNVLKGYANDPKIGPLTKGYFMVSKTGKKGTVQHNVSSVSRTALRDDFDIEPPEQHELDALGLYAPDVVDIPKLRDLRELAEEIASEYDD